MRMRFTLRRRGPRTSRCMFGIKRRLQSRRFSCMPLRPARGINFFVQLAVQKNHRCIRPPGTAEEQLSYFGIGGDSAMIEDVSTLLLRVSFALGCDVGLRMRNYVDMAVIEDRLCVAKNEIHIAFDIAVVEILPRRNAGAGVAPARTACGKQRILRAQKADIAKNGAITAHGQRNGLRTLRLQSMVPAVVVLERHVVGIKIVAGNKSGGGMECAARAVRAIGIDDYNFLGTVRETLQAHMWLGDVHNFAIDTRLDQDRSAVFAERI